MEASSRAGRNYVARKRSIFYEVGARVKVVATLEAERTAFAVTEEPVAVAGLIRGVTAFLQIVE